jgi:hypothetical protein
MFQKLLKKVFSTLKRERRIMQVQKFGEISHMTINLISGPWDVYSMSQLP